MTRHERLLLEAAYGAVRGLTARHAVERLFEVGMISAGACERQAIVGEVDRLTASGMQRCDALHAAARTFCCSYEKARSCYYYQIKKNRK